MISLDRFSRREKWVRFIIDELDRLHPLVLRRLSAAAEARGTTLLARVRARRAQLQTGGRP